MKISILDDYFDTLRTLACFHKLDGHEVTVWNDHTQDIDTLAAQLEEGGARLDPRAYANRSGIARTPRSAAAHQPAQRLSPHRHRRLYASRGHRIVRAACRKPFLYAAAELTWGLIIAAMRQIPQQMCTLRGGTWQIGVGDGLRGKTLGIYGYGRIGQTVAGYGKAFGMNVQVWAREASLQRASKDGYAAAQTKRAFFEVCDVISLHMRLVKETQGIVTSGDLSCMKPSAVLVNTSRAALIQPGTLGMFTAGRPGMAAIDVFEKEPLHEPSDPLLTMDNVVCTPHIGYVTRDEYEIQFSDVFDQITAYAAGNPINVVNPEVFDVLKGQRSPDADRP